VGPLPKRKLSKTSKRTRRNHDKLELPHLIVCEHCGQYKLAHRVCRNCGYYGDTQVVEIKSKDS
jgi:large subunit ribosomal protein L32